MGFCKIVCFDVAVVLRERVDRWFQIKLNKNFQIKHDSLHRDVNHTLELLRNEP